MRSIRSLRRRAQTGLRRRSDAQRRRILRVWRDLADLPSELGWRSDRPAVPLRPIPVEVPIRRR